jgi:hypothetical protein
MLYSYKMTADTGFAPNPFFGFLTLANCKPLIRQKKRVGDYIAGFTSKELCGDPPGMERLVYIMKVTAKITFDEYWASRRYAVKKPSRNSIEATRGDNIYQPILVGRPFSLDNYKQVPNFFHDETRRLHDVSGEFVLVSEDFYYFGAGAIPIDQFAIRIPKTQSPHGVKTDNEAEIQKLLDYLASRYPKNVSIHMPHGWPSNRNRQLSD